jgi:hypothetical protein
MSLSNTTENATLKAHLQGIDPSYRAGATQYLAMFTADPSETASHGRLKPTYTGYARVALTKATAWTGTAVRRSPTRHLIQFGACTAGTNALTHFAVVDTASGAAAQHDDQRRAVGNAQCVQQASSPKLPLAACWRFQCRLMSMVYRCAHCLALLALQTEA